MKWEKEIRKLAYDFCCGLAGEQVIREVKRLPGYAAWSEERRYNEAWRKLMTVI